MRRRYEVVTEMYAAAEAGRCAARYADIFAESAGVA